MTCIAPEDVECDMRVRIEFIDEPKGNVMDIYLVPDGEPGHKKSEQEKARIREKFAPVVEWVADRKPARAQPAPKAGPKASPPKPRGRPRRASRPKASKRAAKKRVVRKEKRKARPGRKRAAKRAPLRARRGRPPKRGRPRKKGGGKR
jgi:hypothetical protein